ncbi:hypothetical protein HHK36_011977 [Tetracentron sinense]|uniref:Uncharacterized protein n=1 Tax=Tetracentron sinense TaxID=13715 RepID=A0A834ZCH3_TETSI|nr:hypothetical protein HHK36_011977 [Tetracentron sinense]
MISFSPLPPTTLTKETPEANLGQGWRDQVMYKPAVSDTVAVASSNTSINFTSKTVTADTPTATVAEIKNSSALAAVGNSAVATSAKQPKEEIKEPVEVKVDTTQHIYRHRVTQQTNISVEKYPEGMPLIMHQINPQDHPNHQVDYNCGGGG